MTVLPVLMTNNDSNNNNTNKNFLLPAYSQTKDDESKNLVEHLQPDMNKKIIGREEIEGFICATYTDGTVYCEEQSKVEYKNKDSLVAAHDNKKNNDSDNDKAIQHERYQPQLQQYEQEQQQQQKMTQASNTATHPYPGASEATDYRTGATDLSISTATDGSSSELRNVLVKPSNNTVKATSNYEIAFTTKTTGTIALIEVKFPPGFELGNANLMQRSGIKSHLYFSSSSFPSTGDTIKLVANPVQTVGSERTIRLNIGNIINSYSPGNDYQVSVATRDAANNIVDGPTVSVPFELTENSHTRSSSSGSNIITQESVSQQYSTAGHNLALYDKEVKETTTATETAEGESYSNNTIIVDELKDGISKDLILGAPPVDKDSVRKIEEVALPCKQGEIATVGGYEIISNTLKQPENNAIKVFVLCVEL